MNIITIKSQCGIEYPVHNHIDDAFLWMQELRAQFIKSMVLPEQDIQIAVWCRGSSGLILATMLVNLLRSLGHYDVVICFVRKDNVQSHGTNNGFKTKTNSFHVIIDDFVCTGNTIIAIEEVFHGHMIKKHFQDDVSFDLGLFSDTSTPSKIGIKTCIASEPDVDTPKDHKIALFDFDNMKGVEF